MAEAPSIVVNEESLTVVGGGAAGGIRTRDHRLTRGDFGARARAPIRGRRSTAELRRPPGGSGVLILLPAGDFNPSVPPRRVRGARWGLGEEEGWRPPFASGRIAGVYEPLRLYLEVARELGREDLVERAVLSEEDFSWLRQRVSQAGRLRLLDLLDELEERFIERVDPEVAREAFRRYGVELSAGDARRRIARLLASWLVEAGEEWGHVKLG